MPGYSLLNGQIIIPATIALPTPVVLGGAALALVGIITLVCIWIAAQN